MWLAALALLAASPAPVSVLTSFRPMTWADLLSRPRPTGAIRLRYGTGAARYGDLWLPKRAGPHPLVVLIHGGCWTKSVADLSIMDWAAADLRDRGLAVWNLEYRGVDEPGGGWPGTYEDVAAGLDFVRTLAPKYPLRTDRVVVAGHSAVGHLALWAPARPRIASGPLKAADPLKIAAVVDISGIPDLEHDRDTPGCGPEPVDKMAGPPRPGRYLDTSPAHLLPLGVPQVVFVGAQDTTVPVAVSQRYAAGAKAAGDTVELHVIPASAHAEEITPGKPAWDAAAARIVELAK